MSSGKKIFILFLNILIITIGLIAVTAISRVEVSTRLQESESPNIPVETSNDNNSVKDNIIDVFNDSGNSGNNAADSDYGETETYGTEDNSYENYTNDYSDDTESDTDADNDAENDTQEQDGEAETDGATEPAEGPSFGEDDGNGNTEGSSDNDGSENGGNLN